MTPAQIAKMLAQKFLPTIIQQLSVKTGIKPRQMGSGPRKELIRRLTVEFKRIKKRQEGGFLGITLAGAATLAGIVATLAPLAVTAAKFLIPKIIGLFKRKRG